MADRVVLNRTNPNLLAANKRKKRQVQRTGIGQGARVLNLEDVEKRKQLAENKERDKETYRLAQKEKQDD